MLRKIYTSKGQISGEYVILIALVSVALVGMSVYVRRAIQGRIRDASRMSVCKAAGALVAGAGCVEPVCTGAMEPVTQANCGFQGPNCAGPCCYNRYWIGGTCMGMNMPNCAAGAEQGSPFCRHACCIRQTVSAPSLPTTVTQCTGFRRPWASDYCLNCLGGNLWIPATPPLTGICANASNANPTCTAGVVQGEPGCNGNPSCCETEEVPGASLPGQTIAIEYEPYYLQSNATTQASSLEEEQVKAGQAIDKVVNSQRQIKSTSVQLPF